MPDIIFKMSITLWELFLACNFFFLRELFYVHFKAHTERCPGLWVSGIKRLDAIYLFM